MRTFIIALLTILTGACAQKDADDIRIENPWIAEIPPMIKVTAALMTLRNNGDAPIYLVAASSPNADSIEIHKSIVVNDLAKMKQQKELKIPAHGSLAFTNESGLHLMLYESRGMQAGNEIPISLEFKDGTTITVNFPVVDRRKMQ